MGTTLSADSKSPLCGWLLPVDAVRGCCPRFLMRIMHPPSALCAGDRSQDAPSFVTALMMKVFTLTLWFLFGLVGFMQGGGFIATNRRAPPHRLAKAPTCSPIHPPAMKPLSAASISTSSDASRPCRRRQAFLKSTEKDKRTKLIGTLLSSEGYNQRMFHFWADLLRIPVACQ